MKSTRLLKGAPAAMSSRNCRFGQISLARPSMPSRQLLNPTSFTERPWRSPCGRHGNAFDRHGLIDEPHGLRAADEFAVGIAHEEGMKAEPWVHRQAR